MDGTAKVGFKHPLGFAATDCCAATFVALACYQQGRAADPAHGPRGSCRHEDVATVTKVAVTH
jgi:hypothetical protein